MKIFGFKIGSIPFKIFLTVLVAGLTGIAGEIVLNRNIDRLSENYTEIVEGHYVNIAHSDDVNVLLHRHQAIVANHVTAQDEKDYEKYEAEAAEIEAQLNVVLEEFGARMTGDRREQLFHSVYSDYQSYLQNAEIALRFSRQGDKKTAAYYTINVMDAFLDTANGHLADLCDYTYEEMSAAEERMEYYMQFSQVSAIVCISAIVLAMTVCIVYCVKVTAKLDRYKDSLEEEVERKTRDLRLHSEKMLELQNNTIIGMANLIESRDGDTGEHVKRTSKYVAMLAETARERALYPELLTDSYIELLTKAAPMHDIGKISVPDSILQKPGKLDPEEYERIKDHAAEGGRIIREVLGNIEEQEYVDIAAMVASGHHEKWDGSGYPAHLSGESIPLCARIMAIADVFDALISKRCYKEPMTLDAAFGIISESAGSHFDPVLAELFISLRPQIEAYLSENPAWA